MRKAEENRKKKKKRPRQNNRQKDRRQEGTEEGAGINRTGHQRRRGCASELGGLAWVSKNGFELGFPRPKS